MNTHRNNDLACIHSQYCQNGCEQIIRSNKSSIEAHDEICELKEISCDICQVVVRRNAMEDHDKMFSLQHVAILRVLLKESEQRHKDALLQLDGNLYKRLDSNEAVQQDMLNKLGSMLKYMEMHESTNAEIMRYLNPRTDSDLGKHSRSVSKTKNSKGCFLF
jgi:hypothetical protein